MASKNERPPLHNLPRQLTSFVGRELELAHVVDLLSDPACGLLTLVGPGGMGKTRLAVQAVGQMIDAFADGVCFIPLQAVDSSNFLVTAITEALNVPLGSQVDRREQLFDYLSDKEMLLVLDNFEQLLSPLPQQTAPSGQDTNHEADGQPLRRGATTLIATLLATAPGVKLLITSREVLSLQEEWLYPLEGLLYPDNVPDQTSQDPPAAYGAVRLFVERAGRVRHDFTLAGQEAAVYQICRLVEGMPLGLELAASWTKTMSCQAIAAEIQRNQDFLATKLRNIPERHRSIQAVFVTSWQRLNRAEQAVFKRLSVFRSGFQREAAEKVAGASLATLSALVDKSLVRWEPEGRYQIHELLRQYAAEQLVQTPEDVATIYDRHGAYYADFLHHRAEAMTDARQQATTQEIAAELENIRAAWWHAVVQIDLESLHRAAYTFYLFCDFQGRFQECAAAFDQATACLEAAAGGKQALTLANLLTLQGYNYIRLGQLDRARQAFEQSQAMYDRLDRQPPPGFGTDPTTGLGLWALTVGDYAQAIALSQAARQRMAARADHRNLQINLYVLAGATFAQGDYDTARTYAHQAYALTEAEQNQWMMAYILTLLGNIARVLGDYDRARAYYQAGYDIKQAFNDPEGMAAALNHLGQVAWLQQDYAAAAAHYGHSEAIYEQIHDRGGLARAWQGLGDTAQRQGDGAAARRYLQQALHTAVEMAWVPLTLSILVSTGDLLSRTGQVANGVAYLTTALTHPAGDRETKDRAQVLLTQAEERLSAEAFAAARQRGLADDLDSVIVRVQSDLIGGRPQADTPLAPSLTTSSTANAALVEPLTGRELEVLHLIAQGLTNQEIADHLIISLGTTKWYTAQIYGKLGVSSRTQAVALGRELALIT